jgi:ParB family chromosome partitioning protein
MSKGKKFFPATKSHIPTKSEETKHAQASQGEVPASGPVVQREEQRTVETVTQTIERHLSPDQRISSQDIPLSRIRPNPFQAREEFTDEDLEELAESIRRHGFISTLLVRPDPTEDGYFQLAYGERRWRAARRVEGLHAVPCRISTYSDEQIEDMSIVENLQRKPLNPIEEARGLYKRMQRIDPETGKSYTIRSLAAHLGVGRHRVEIPLRLIDLPSELEAMVRQRHDTVRIAYEIAKLPTALQRQPLIDLVLAGAASTRDIIYMVDQQLKAQAAIEQELAEAHEQKQQSSSVILPPSGEEQQQPVSGFQQEVSQRARQEEGAPEEEQLSEESLSARADTVHEVPDQPREETRASVASSIDIEAMQRQRKMQQDIRAMKALIQRWSRWAETGEVVRSEMSFQVTLWIRDLKALQDVLQGS